MTKIIKKIMVITSFLVVSTISLGEEPKLGFMNNLKELKEISDVMDIIQDNFVGGEDEVTKTKLMQGALKGMIESLDDPHSNYFSEKGMDDLQGKIKGEYSGVGMIIRKGANEAVTVELLIEGTPSFNAGIRPNDKILYIEDKNTYDLELEEASRLLRGEAGTKVKLKIYRPSEKKETDITLTRADIKLESVSSKMLDNKIGYIKLTQFGEDVDVQIRERLEKLQKEGMEGLIFDLRNNPGGIIGQAISIGSMFIDEGVIVSERAKKGVDKINYRTGKYYGDFPLVILINEGSASASEIVSGAIRDHKRGILVGEKSYGKGSVQVLLPLPDKDGIKLTIAKYFTPNGEDIHGKGITPDIVIEEKDDYLFYDGLITNVDEKVQEENKEKLLETVVGEEKAKELIKREDIQLKKAEEVILEEIKKRKNNDK